MCNELPVRIVVRKLAVPLFSRFGLIVILKNHM